MTDIAALQSEILAQVSAATDEAALDAVRKEFNGAQAGQTVFHTHFHVIPRWQQFALGRHAGGGMADLGELQIQAKKIAAQLK